MKKVYRYEIDKSTEEVEKLFLTEIEITKETPKGYRVGKKFSLKNGYYSESKEIALKNFIIKKNNQIKILKSQISSALIGIEIAKKTII